MKKIKLTRGMFALVDDEDFEKIVELKKYKWQAKIQGTNFYAQRINGGRKERHVMKMHRLIMNPKSNEIIDHINGNGLDNRKENLRICNQSQNMANQRLRCDNKSGFRGVWKDPNNDNRYMAYINFKGKRKFLGYYKDIRAAAFRYDLKAIALFGEFARLNFPRENISAIA